MHSFNQMHLDEFIVTPMKREFDGILHSRGPRTLTTENPWAEEELTNRLRYRSIFEEFARNFFEFGKHCHRQLNTALRHSIDPIRCNSKYSHARGTLRSRGFQHKKEEQPNGDHGRSNVQGHCRICIGPSSARNPVFVCHCFHLRPQDYS